MLANAVRQTDDRPVDGSAYGAYGLRLNCCFPLSSGGSGGRQGVELMTDLVEAETLMGRWSGAARPVVLRTVMSDGEELTVEQGHNGDHLVRYGDRGLFLISADVSTVICAPADAHGDPGWQRVLLDWVMFFAASLSGRQALHASAVAVEGRAIAFCAASGGGKSTAALELLRRGGSFISDDVLCLASSTGRVCGEPGAPFMNLQGAATSAEIGELRGRIGDERWVRVSRVTSDATPIGGIFLLDRADRHSTLEVVDCSLFELRQYCIGLPHLLGLEAQRFALLSELMTQGPVCRIVASQAVTPTVLTSVALEHMGRWHASDQRWA